MTSEDEFPPGYDGQSQADREDAEELRVQIEREEKAWKEWRADHPSGVYNIPYVAFMAGRKSQRSRIAALEAVIQQMRDAWDSATDWPTFGGEFSRLLRGLAAAPSTVLDQMIREAKAEALEWAAERIEGSPVSDPGTAWFNKDSADFIRGLIGEVTD